VRDVLVLRPRPQADATAARARGLGLTVHCQPLFTILPVPWTLPDEPFDALLLTSANAVRHAGRLPPLPAHAVGPATAAAARAAGLEVASVGVGGVDDLLAALPGDLRLLHLCGADRIQLAATEPKIVAVTVYRAEQLPLPPASQVEGRVLLVHSPAAGARLLDLDCSRQKVRIAAISAEAARACGPGWAGCEAATKPTDTALLSLACELCKD